jgi:hypothetical protein
MISASAILSILLPNLPWFDLAWIALGLALGFLKPVWRWFQRQRASSWPTAAGEIRSASVSENKRFFHASAVGRRAETHTAQLNYSYSVAGNMYFGKYNRDFGTEEEARDFVRELKGKPVSVQFNPSRPSASTLSEPSIETLLQTRAPKPASEFQPTAVANRRLAWMRPFLWLFVGLSAVGLLVSLWVHLGAVMGRRDAPPAFFWLLHIGILVVWIPAIFVAKLQFGNRQTRDYWKRALKASPAWMRYMVYGFFGYAMVNFLLFISHAPADDGGVNPPAVVWRGFSGHWMAFYSAALAIFYSATRTNIESHHCLNGHPVPTNADFCTRCGQSVIHV